MSRKGGPNPASLLCLNVYDLTPLNGYMYWLGLGIYHSAVQAYGVEYGFGAHDLSITGVFEVEPRSCPGFTFRKSVPMGTLNLSPKEFRKFMEDIANEYRGNSYHLIAKNCNHFCDDVCARLIGRSIPGWVNRLARLGSFCNCLLPESLQASVVHHALEDQPTEETLEEWLGHESEQEESEEEEEQESLLTPERL